MQTLSKEPESPSMTHEEEEEILHDISKLQEQVQQMSCSQKLTAAKINGMECKIKGMEAKMEDSKIDLKRHGRFEDRFEDRHGRIEDKYE